MNIKSVPLITNTKINGVPEVLARLDQLTDALKTKMLIEGMRAAFQVTQWRAEQNAPVGETGNLADSIERRTLPMKMWPSLDTPTVVVAARARHAHLIEYGHRMVGPKPNKKEVGFVAARPFLLPALIQTYPQVIGGLAKEIDAALDRWARRTANKMRREMGME